MIPGINDLSVGCSVSYLSTLESERRPPRAAYGRGGVWCWRSAGHAQRVQKCAEETSTHIDGWYAEEKLVETADLQLVTRGPDEEKSIANSRQEKRT